MADATAEFFDGLAKRGSEPLLGRITGRVRVDVVDGGRTRQWVVSLRNGDVAVAEGDGAADCVIRADRAAFEEVATGHINAMAAGLRGLLMLEGDPRLVARFQRLFPPPVGMPKQSGARTVGKRRG
jgi:putative sterol carrier protein